MWIVAVIIVLVFIIVCVFLVNESNKEKTNYVHRKYAETDEKISRTKEYITERGFQITNEFELLLIDTNQKEWCIVPLNGSLPYVHKFSSLADFTIVENGREYKSDNGVIRSVVGGVLLGTVGAVAGNASAKTSETINTMSLSIFTADFERSTETISFISFPTNTSGVEYQEAVRRANQYIGLLTAIKANI